MESGKRKIQKRQGSERAVTAPVQGRVEIIKGIEL
jgi:hypothetical protein